MNFCNPYLNFFSLFSCRNFFSRNGCFYKSPEEGGIREVMLQDCSPGHLLLCYSPRHSKLFWLRHSQNFVWRLVLYNSFSLFGIPKFIYFDMKICSLKFLLFNFIFDIIIHISNIVFEVFKYQILYNHVKYYV